MSDGLQGAHSREGPSEQKPEAELATRRYLGHCCHPEAGQEPGCPAQEPPRAWPALVRTGGVRHRAEAQLFPLQTLRHQAP